MFIIKIEINVFVLKIYLIIQEINVYNVYNLIFGIIIKKDVFNVLINKFMIELEEFVHLVQKMHRYLKITNVIHVQKIHILIV
jgi:hypothetical protein